jgi:hypothetical protein
MSTNHLWALATLTVPFLVAMVQSIIEEKMKEKRK